MALRYELSKDGTFDVRKDSRIRVVEIRRGKVRFVIEPVPEKDEKKPAVIARQRAED